MAKPTSIKKVVEEVLGTIRRSKAGKTRRFSEAWEEVAGESVASHASVVKHGSGRIIVGVDSAVWMQELSLRKSELLRGLQTVLGEDSAQELIFRKL